jgi:hypothetical protein
MDYLNSGMNSLKSSFGSLTSKGGRRRKSHRKRKHRGGGCHVSSSQYGADAAPVGGRRSKKHKKHRKSRKSRRRY